MLADPPAAPRWPRTGRPDPPPQIHRPPPLHRVFSGFCHVFPAAAALAAGHGFRQGPRRIGSKNGGKPPKIRNPRAAARVRRSGG